MATTLKDLPEYGAKVGWRPQVFVSDENSRFGGINCLTGVKILINDDLPSDKKWVFPYDKFIEYGPKDEWWAIPWGFGHWERKPVAYEVNIGGEWVVHCNKEFLVKIEGLYGPKL